MVFLFYVFDWSLIIVERFSLGFCSCILSTPLICAPYSLPGNAVWRRIYRSTFRILLKDTGHRWNSWMFFDYWKLAACLHNSLLRLKQTKEWHHKILAANDTVINWSYMLWYWKPASIRRLISAIYFQQSTYFKKVVVYMLFVLFEWWNHSGA